VVVVVAVTFGLFARSLAYTYRAGRYAEAERHLNWIVHEYEAGRLRLLYTKADIEHHRRLIFYHAAMRRKYESATLWPWLFVGPDPPKPD
jgi:hypothetical protein